MNNDQILELDGQEERQSEIHLAEYWAVVVKHRYLIALCVLLALAVAAVRSLLATPTYQAMAIVNIEKEKLSPFDVDSSPAFYYSWDPEFLPTQTRLIKSRQVSERVVRELALLENPEFNPEVSGAVREVVSAAGAEQAVTSAAVRVQSGIGVTPIRGTNLVELTYVSTSPKLAAEIANAVADAYIDWSMETKYETLGQASKFMTSQIEQLKAEIRQKEQQLQAYGRDKGIISTDPKANVTLQNLETLNRDYAEAVSDRVAKEARYREVQNASPEALADTLSGTLISQLRNEQMKLERDYTDKLTVYKPEFPVMQQLKAQIDKGRQNISSVVQETVQRARDNARTEYMTALRREQNLQAVLQGQKNEAMDLNTASVEYINLQTEVDTKRQLLDSLLKRESETQMRSRLRNERVSNIRLVDRALPPNSRFSPSYRKNGMTGLFLGLFAGIGLAFLLEYLDRSLRSIKQVEQHLKLPALGVIPSVGDRAFIGYGYGRRGRKNRKKSAASPVDTVSIEMIPDSQPRSTVAEAYRAFRAALLLSRAGGVRSIVISSSLPGEGKTSTAANLAVVLAQLHKRVLLVDGDLHKPRMHEVFRVSNRVGLVSILAENIAAASAITETNISGLSLLTAGPTSPNPSGLLASDRMSEFLQYAAANYDFVVIDTPPVSPVADAILIGHQCDGLVLCVQGGRTSRELVARVRDKLSRSGVRILGVLLNNLEEKSFDYGYYHKYYGGHYGEEAGYTQQVTGSKAV